MSISQWSTTAADNNDADATINWTEGQAPSTVNDSSRAMMAAIKKWYLDGVAGNLVTGGTSTAYTLTSNQTFGSLALMDQALLTFAVHTTSGASPTLNVDGLGAKALVTAPGVAPPAGTLITSAFYTAVYRNEASEWRLVGLAGLAGALQAPATTKMLFMQTSAPTGWTKDTSTHNDKALRIVTGTPSSGGSVAFSTVFGQSATGSTAADLAAHTHAVGTLAAGDITVNHVHNPPNLTTTAAQSGAGVTVVTGYTVGSTAAGQTSNDLAQHGHTITGSTASSGSGGGHTHTMDIRVHYADVIAATKD